MRRAFTIVELLVAIGILSVLLGIVVTAASHSVAATRDQRASALCQSVSTAAASYYAQNGKWPGSLGDKVANGSMRDRSNREGVGGETIGEMYVLEPSEVRSVVKAIVDEAKQGNPLMDISELFVSRQPGEKGDKSRGLFFMQAVRGTKQSKKKMKTSEMYFGYMQGDGHFRRFKMIYSIPSDSLEVTKQQ